MIEPYQVQEWRDNSLGDLPLNGKVSNMVEWSVVLNDGGQKCRLLYHQTSIVGEVEKFVEMGISKNTTIFRNVYFYIFSYFDLGSVLQHPTLVMTHPTPSHRSWSLSRGEGQRMVFCFI